MDNGGWKRTIEEDGQGAAYRSGESTW